LEADRPAEVAAAVEVAAEEDGAGARRAHPTRLLVRDNIYMCKSPGFVICLVQIDPNCVTIGG